VSWKRRLANRLLFGRLADDITAVCEFSARALAEKDGFPRDRITVVPNGIDLDRYQTGQDKATLRDRLGWPRDRRFLVIVARFHPVKDHATLVSAFGLVASRHPDLDLVLVGDGELREPLHRQVQDLHLSDRVRFMGVRSDVPDILQAADIFALSSLSEAASITLLEAMACGLPVIVTNVGGNPELVRENIDGLLVPRRDPQAFAAAIERVLASPAAAAAMGQSGARRVRDTFQMTQTIDTYYQLYASGQQ
jgi:glycosyltransferase involved in cell wall biosynthesis